MDFRKGLLLVSCTSFGFRHLSAQDAIRHNSRQPTASFHPEPFIGHN
jgi:hypothetical protein